MEQRINNKVNLYDDSKRSVWEIVSEEFDTRHKENSKLVRVVSTPNITNNVSTKLDAPVNQRMGSHISAKIRQLQLSQEEGRKRHVSESDRSSILESHTSAATFKDTRQLVFLDETEGIATAALTVNKPFIMPVTTTSTYVKSSPATATITPITTQKLPLKLNTNVNTKNVPVTQQTVIKSPKIIPKKIYNYSQPTSNNTMTRSSSPLSTVPSINIDSSDNDSDISQEIFYYQKPPEHLHSETIRIRTASESEQTLELTVTVSQKSSNDSQNNNTHHTSSILSPTQKMKFSLDDDHPKPSSTPRRSFVFPNFLKLLPSHNERRNSAPIRPKPPKLHDNDDVEVLNFKLEAVAINAAYLLARAQDFCGTVDELIDLEEEIERTQRALDDVEVMAPQNMRSQVASATRALNACKMILEERSPSIETLEVGQNRKRSSSINVGDVRSVSMRVMKLNKEEEKRRSSCFDSTP